MPKLSIYNSDGKEKGSVELSDELFGGRLNKTVIHQTVVMYRANQRQGNASTKDRSEVSGGGKKPFRQKGTGRARAGSSRSPLWHGGGKIFGPMPRDYSYSLPKQVRIAALRETIKAKLQSNELICVEDFNVSSGKTKDFVKVLSNFDLKGKVLALLDGCNETVFRACRNLEHFRFERSSDVSVYDLIVNKNILLTKKALENLLKRVQ